MLITPRVFALLLCAIRSRIIQGLVLVSVTLIATAALCVSAKAQPSTTDLSPQDQVLLEEVQNIVSKLGPALWPGWKTFPPFLIREAGREYLIRHPNPPKDFQPFDSAVLHQRVWTRVVKDTSDIQASYPLNGVRTAMMSAPNPDDNAYVWVLKAAHEAFPCYQGESPVPKPFAGKFAHYNDLTFPFPYTDSAVMAAVRLEAEFVFRLATAKADNKDFLLTQSRLLPLAWRVERALYRDSTFNDYKLHTEWSEGVARYTERELARLAGTAGEYAQTPAFARTFPASNYAAVWRDQYGDVPMLNPIRFVGEGVRGRVMFYYLGMGKAYALDRMNPKWRASYNSSSLDDLLQKASTELTR